MSLTTDRHAEGSYGRDISFEVQTHNVGARPIWVALRARQLSFRVYTMFGSSPDGSSQFDGEAHCSRISSDHWVPRDNFELLPPHKHIHVAVRLSEVCPPDVFARPGLYAVVPTLHADDNGSEYGIVALTGTVSTRDPGRVGGTHLIDDDATLVRVRVGDRPFYAEPPTATATKPPAESAAATDRKK